MKQTDTIKLNNGLLMPIIGFGTWQILLSGRASRAVEEALQAGYRLIDTTRIYGNERGVGLAIRQSELPRQDIFLTTKLWNNSHGRSEAKQAFGDSLSRLGLDYVDLYLIHWPASGKLIETWQALEEIAKSGKAKAIGVSNYGVEELKETINNSKTIPAVNQIEFHPFVYSKQKPILEFCAKHNIAVEAYSPLARGGSELNHPTVSKIAARVGKTNAQVMIRWAIQHGTIPIPKSSHPERIRENLDVFNFELSTAEIEELDNV